MERLVLIDMDGFLYKNIEDLDEYKDRVDNLFDSVIEATSATHYKCFIESKGNQTFRKVLNKSYKSNRKKKDYHNREEIRDYIINNYDPFISVGVESDDSIISTRKYVKDNYPLTEVWIAANDKDYLTHPINYIDTYHGRWLMKEKISKEDAMYNFFYQMIKGDSSDNVPGVKGLGDKKTKFLLENTSGNYFGYKRLLLFLYKQQYKRYTKAKEEIMISYIMLKIRDDVRASNSFVPTFF